MFIDKLAIRDFKFKSKKEYNKEAQELQLIQSYSPYKKDGTELMRELNHPDVRSLLTCLIEELDFPNYVDKIYITYKADTVAMLETLPQIEDSDEQLLVTNFVKLKKLFQAYNDKEDCNFYRAEFVRTYENKQ